jgi:ankyrin repeat protein
LIDIVKFFVDQKIDVNCKTQDGWNALHLVCRYYKKNDLIDIVRLLLKQQIDINSQENNGWNALHFVCRYQPRNNLMNLVRLLIEHKIDKNVKTTGVEIRTAQSFLVDRSRTEDVTQIITFLKSFNI